MTITGYGVIVLVNIITAGARVSSPAWNKVITHDPAASAVSVYVPSLPPTVQTAELVLALVMVTGRDWLLVALIFRGVSGETVIGLGMFQLMLCAVLATVIVLVNVIVAGARVSSPAWNKVITHDPAASAVSVYVPSLPPTVQTAELVLALVMVTGRDWLLVALIFRGVSGETVIGLGMFQLMLCAVLARVTVTVYV